MQCVSKCSQRPDNLSSLWNDGLSERDLLQVTHRGQQHARSGETQHRLWGWNGSVFGCQLCHHRGHPWKKSMYLGLNLS